MTALESQVLVLNRLWQPVNTCTARRAVKLLFLGQAQVVHRGEDSCYTTHDAASWLEASRRGAIRTDAGHIRSIKTDFLVPEIIVLCFYDRFPKKDVKFTRHNIFVRDRHTCQYCGRIFDPKDLNLDHVIPRDKGGRTTWENVVASCIRCNSRKANKLPHEARMFPLHAPRAPKWRPFHSSIRPQAPHVSWRDFLEVADGTVEISH